MKPKIIYPLLPILATLCFIWPSFSAFSDEILYQTSFESPAFTPGLLLRGQDDWRMHHDPEAIFVSAANPRTGTQCLRFDGPLLVPLANGNSVAYCWSGALEALDNNPPPIIELTASVRLDGPQTGMLGTPDQDLMSANIYASEIRSDGLAYNLAGFLVSSAGRIFTSSQVPEDRYKYSVPYTLGTYRTLRLRVDFLARRVTWCVDGVELGSGAFSPTGDRLASGFLFMQGPTDRRTTPEYDYDPATYTAYFDDYSLVSIPAEGPTLLVEHPFGTRLAKGSAVVDFDNRLVGTTSSRVFMLRNAGNAPLGGVTVTVDGPHAAEFALTAPPSGTVAPGGNTPFTITFTPAAEGARSATLRIASNDPDDNPFTLVLTGRGRSPAEIVQQAYLKASNTETFDFFGTSVAISGDTMVVGAPNEDSNARGVNGTQSNNSASDSGAAYIFVRNGNAWVQQAYLKASNTEPINPPRFNVFRWDFFGSSVAISGDTVVVGAPAEGSSATGVNADQSDNSANGAGAVYVFVREGTNWTQQAYLKASNTGGLLPGQNFGGDRFGTSVSVSDGTIVVGAPAEDSKATGVNGDQSDNSATDSGAAYVFARKGTNWTQEAYLKASNTEKDDSFGLSVSVSGDAIVVGTWNEDSDATGVNGNQNNNSAANSGAAYVFAREGTNWTQQAYLKASNTGTEDNFGYSVVVSGDVIVVGAPYESSNATGVNGNQTNNSAYASGATYVFVREGTDWVQQAYLKASNTQAEEYFGGSVSISGDSIVVGAPYESSNATGVNGNQNNNSAFASGATYVFVREGTIWTQQAYLKASNTGGPSSGRPNGDNFGYSVAVSGGTVVVGAWEEDSDATGVNGNQKNNSAGESGAVYVFTGAGPLAPGLPPRIVSIVRAPGGAIVLPVETAPGRSYTLQVSEDLAAWTDLSTRPATTNRIEFTDTPAANTVKRFYRVEQR